MSLFKKKSLSLNSSQRSTVQTTLKGFFAKESSGLASSESVLGSSWSTDGQSSSCTSKPAKPVAAIRPHQPNTDLNDEDDDIFVDEAFSTTSPLPRQVQKHNALNVAQSSSLSDEVMTRGWGSSSKHSATSRTAWPSTSQLSTTKPRQATPFLSALTELRSESDNEAAIGGPSDDDNDEDPYFLDMAEQETMIEDTPSDPPDPPVLRSPPRCKSPIIGKRKFVLKTPSAAGVANPATNSTSSTTMMNSRVSVTNNTLTSNKLEFVEHKQPIFSPTNNKLNSSISNQPNWPKSSTSFRSPSRTNKEDSFEEMSPVLPSSSKFSSFKPKVSSYSTGSNKMETFQKNNQPTANFEKNDTALNSTTSTSKPANHGSVGPPAEAKEPSSKSSAFDAETRILQWITEAESSTGLTSTVSGMDETGLQDIAQSLRFLSVDFLENLFTVWDKPGSLANMNSAIISKFRTVGMRLRAKNRLIESKLKTVNEKSTGWPSESQFSYSANTSIETSVPYNIKSNTSNDRSDFYDLTSSPLSSQEQYPKTFSVRENQFTDRNVNNLDCVESGDGEERIPRYSTFGNRSSTFQCKSSAVSSSLIKNPPCTVTSHSSMHPTIERPSVPLPFPTASASKNYKAGGDAFDYEEAIDWQDSPPSDYEEQSNSRMSVAKKTPTATQTRPSAGGPVPVATDEGDINYMNVLFHNTSTSPQSNKKSNTSKPSFSLGKFHGNARNDGASNEFSGFKFPHSQNLKRVFRERFGLHEFRPNQLEAINASLLGHDCFILMPTGGGKSLCYQLPALLTGGVTVVISPLKSLIQDQVQKLQSLDIPAQHLSGEITLQAQNSVYNKLNCPEPGITLLYVTPEKISASSRLIDTLDGLYKRNKLARFVIDEAHCVSQWGHDFRPDYKKLNTLSDKFPNVPTMALTATATPRVRTDVLHQLHMTTPKWFLSSFNRPNLQYSVIPKIPRRPIEQVIELLKSNQLRGKCGIVYCLSRKDCDNMAQTLKDSHIQAISYHAGLSDKDRASVQHRWTTDNIKVVCATIAFGMGIDKADVRFVIHFSVPKSIEGYYQESGRAGRDGEYAKCILLYNYADVKRIQRMIEQDGAQNRAAQQTHINNLFRMVGFCDNKMDCRRTLQLNYFGEVFSRSECLANRATACDNCLAQGNYETVDVTDLSKEIVQTIRQQCGTPSSPGSRFTLLHFVDVLRGSEAKKIVESGHKQISLHGKGSSWLRTDLERLFRKLLLAGFLYEEFYVTKDGIAVSYVRCGPQSDKLITGNEKITFSIKKKEGSTNNSPAIGTPVSTPQDDSLRQVETQCLRCLQEEARKLALEHTVSVTSIMNSEALKIMAKELPETPLEMLKISHVTEANFKKYGQHFLKITQEYAQVKLAMLSEIAEEMSGDDAEELTSIDMPASTTPSARGSGAGYKRKGRGNYAGFRKKRFKKGASGGAAKRGTWSQSGSGRGGGSSRGNTARGRSSSTRGGQASSTNTSHMLALPTPRGRTFLPTPQVSRI